MTLVMNNKYGYSSAGIKAFLLNRFLRIYPPYWFLAGITLVGILLLPDSFYAMHKSLRMPQGFHEVFSNLFIFGLFPWIEKSGEVLFMARLVPPAWALHVELCFYVLIGLFLARTKSLIIIWFLLSAVYHLVALFYGYPRYAPVYAASLPFSIGALIYFYRDVVVRLVPLSKIWVATLLFVYLLYILLAGALPMATDVYPAYLNIAIAAVLICHLSVINAKAYPMLGRVDSFLGDLSYPVYLGHWFVAVILATVSGLERSPSLFFASAPFILVLGGIVKFMIDDPVERQRKSIAASLSDRQ